MRRTWAGGEALVGQGRPAPGLLALVAGRTKMVRELASGRSVILALHGPGDWLGVVAALGGGESDASILALEPVVAFELGRHELAALLGERPDLIPELLPRLARNLAECRNCLVELVGARAENRFAQIFLKLADGVGQPAGGGVRVPIRLSRQELADLAGTTLETAIRILSRWHQEGVLLSRSGGFLLVDRTRLEQAAGAQPR